LLGGSAPRLRTLFLHNISFLGLPNLLLSATHLANLWLFDIPHSGYLSPEAMATCLSTLTSLETLRLEFESPQSSPEQENRHSPPPTRSVLPVLVSFWFKGVNEYLEELVAQIDTPRLLLFSATLFNDLDLDTPELIRFISRSSTLEAPDEAHVVFANQTASVKLQPQASDTGIGYFNVEILCKEPGWQLSSLAQICTTSLPILSTMENLFICEPVGLQLDWKDGIEDVEWLELLLPFAAVKNLYLSKQFAPRIAPALQVLSALQNLYLEGWQPSESVEDDIERFISTRQPTDHPVAISVWERPRDDIGGP
jgi:hypothetical protein